MSEFKVFGCVCLVGLLVLAAPMMVEQACHDDGDGWSGAVPDYPSHEEAWMSVDAEDDSLPPVCE